jgi:hypothetical protein
MLGAAAPAQAAVTHIFDASFEVPGNPRAIAVDETSNSVYVLTESSPWKLKKFDGSGAPSNFSALGSNEITLSTTPRTIAVDNSGGINNGVIYIGTYTDFAYVYTPAGLLSAEFSRSSSSDRYPGAGDSAYCGMAVDSSGNWYVSHPYGFIQTPYIDKFHPGQWIGNASPQQNWSISGTMVGLPQNVCKIAIDGQSSIYANTSEVTGSGQLLKYASSVFSLEEPPSKTIDVGNTSFSVDNSNDNVYSDRNSSIARFDSDGILREVFATGEFELSAGVAVNSNDSTVYATVRKAGGATKNEVRIYKGVVTPDISGVSASAGQTGANLAAHIGTAGAGNVTGCNVEYGTFESYGSNASCVPDASGTPYSGPQDATVALAGLEKEKTYHYRFTATNANGTNKDIDGTFTTHNVADLKTEEPTEVTQHTATLNASFTGNGEPVTYEFQYGPTTLYGNSVSGSTGGTGPVAISEGIESLETYQPSGEGIYHYRIVATNGSGTTIGPDVVFHTAPPALPQISQTASEEVTETSAKVSAMINPGNGDTVYSVDYGLDEAYGSSTLVSQPIGNDETDHPVSSILSGLQPGRAYHFRIVAVNFGGTSYGADQTFTTIASPEAVVPPVTNPPATQTPVQPPAEERKAPPKCRRGFVRRHGKCVRKKHRKHRHRSHAHG